jgi:hypothetical protein
MLTLHAQIVRGLTQSPQADADADADDTAAVQARNVEIRRTLRERLGEAAAADLIDRTNRYLEQHADLEQLLNRGRADAFLTIAQHVQDKRIR